MLLIIIFFIFASCEIEAQNIIIELSDEDIKEAIKTNSILALNFYYPRCAYCDDFEPIFQQSALIGAAKNYTFARINGMLSTRSPERYKIHGFPTLLLFINGSMPFEYEGDRNPESILNWISFTQSRKVISCDSLNITQTAIVLVGNNTNDKKNLIWLSKNFAGSSDATICSIEQLKTLTKKEITSPSFVLLNFVRTRFMEIPINISIEELVKIIKKMSWPLVIEIDSEQMSDLLKPNTTSLFYVASEQIIKESIGVYKRLAYQHTDINFVLVFTDHKYDGDINHNFINYFQLPSVPSFMITVIDRNKQITKYLAGTNVTDLAHYLIRFTKGLLPIYYKSEPIPENGSDEILVEGINLTKIVGNNHHQFINQNYLIIYENPEQAYDKLLFKIIKYSNLKTKIGYYNLIKNENEEINTTSSLMLRVYNQNGKYNKISRETDNYNSIIKFMKENYHDFALLKYVKETNKEEI